MPFNLENYVHNIVKSLYKEFKTKWVYCQRCKKLFKSEKNHLLKDPFHKLQKIKNIL